MDTTIHSTFLPHDDPDASLASYRDALGFEVCNDVAYGVTYDERRTITEMMVKGNFRLPVRL